MLVYDKDGNPFTVVYVPFPQDSNSSMTPAVPDHYGRLPPLWQRRLWGYNNPRYPDYKPRGSGAPLTTSTTHRKGSTRGKSGYYFSHKKQKWVKSKFVTRHISKQRSGR